MKVIIAVISILFLGACNSDFTPKPRGYFKIGMPERDYQQFDEEDYPYSFEYPTYATVSKEKDSTGNDPYWINIDFEQFKGRIYLSYKSIQGKSVYKVKSGNGYRDSVVSNSFEKLREESYAMTYKHTVKASGIVDSLFSNPHGYAGVYFYVAGEAATSKQFFITDSTRHFLRGALYFDATPNEDSISVVSNFLEQDMRRMISTLKFKK